MVARHEDNLRLEWVKVEVEGLMMWRNSSALRFKFPRQEFVCFDICTYPSLPLTINVHPALIFLNLPRMLFQNSTVGRRVTEKPQKSPRHSELSFMILGSYVRDQRLILSFFNRIRWPRPSMSSWKKDLSHSFLPITALRYIPFFVLSFLYFNWRVVRLPCNELQCQLRRPQASHYHALHVIFIFSNRLRLTQHEFKGCIGSNCLSYLYWLISRTTSFPCRRCWSEVRPLDRSESMAIKISRLHSPLVLFNSAMRWLFFTALFWSSYGIWKGTATFPVAHGFHRHSRFLQNVMEGRGRWVTISSLPESV